MAYSRWLIGYGRHLPICHLAIRHPAVISPVRAQDYLAELPAIFHALLCRSGVPQRKNFIDDGLGPRSLHKVERLLKLIPVSQGRTEDVEVVPKDAPDVGLRGGSIGGAAGDESPAFRQSGKALDPTLTANTIDDHVDAALPGHLSRFFREI